MTRFGLRLWYARASACATSLGEALANSPLVASDRLGGEAHPNVLHHDQFRPPRAVGPGLVLKVESPAPLAPGHTGAGLSRTTSQVHAHAPT